MQWRIFVSALLRRVSPSPIPDGLIIDITLGKGGVDNSNYFFREMYAPNIL